MSKNLSKRAKEIIHDIDYITIASVTKDGLPWNSPVFSAFDDDYNFYWGTNKDSQKARNIESNPNVFLVIYDSTVPAGEGEGVYIQATSTQLTDPQEIADAHRLLQGRRPVPYWKLEQVQGDAPVRLYKAVPQRVWMNEDGEKDGHYVDIRTDIKL